VKQGYDKIPIRTVDTGVIVLEVTSAQCLNIANCGLHVVLGRTSDIYRPTRWPTHWVRTVVLLCQCIMPSLVVTRCNMLRAGANGLHWIGVPMTKTLQLSVL